MKFNFEPLTGDDVITIQVGTVVTKEIWIAIAKSFEAIQRVRELHKPIKSLFGFVICETCLKDFPTEYSSTYSVVPYPCPTIKALDGEQ